jgi:hypothetical protein
MKLSTWAELVGLAAVVVSLVFVGFEIRHNTATTSSQALLDLNDAVNTAMLLQSEDAELAEIVLRGHEDPHSLTAVEMLRYERLIWSVLNSMEAAFNFYEADLLTPEQYEGWLAASCAELSIPGSAFVWRKNKAAFSPRFNELLEDSCEAIAK